MTKRNGKEHVALKMTLREAFDAYYDKTDLAPRSLLAYGFCLSRWERHSGNPPIGEIDDATLERFKRSALADGISAATFNGTRRTIRVILRRLGPRETRNPGALGLISSVSYVRPCREVKAVPRRLDLDDEISRFYLACTCMSSPRWGGPPGWWWQGLAVWLFTTGMRLRDALRVRWAHVDFGGKTVLFTARKTLKASEMPVHPVALEHVARIRTEREFVFESKRLYRSGDFHREWRRICDEAHLAAPFTPHDLRKTAASEINRAAAAKGLPPMAGVLLQHSSKSVTDIHYANQQAELAEALEALRLPIAFRGGIKAAERQLEKSRRQATEMMSHALLAPATFPNPAEFDFRQPFGFSVRGQYVPMRGAARAILESLVTSPTRRCDLEDLCRAVWSGGRRPASYRTLQGRICDSITTIRERLRHVLHLPPGYDPVPCIERGRGGVWTVYLPALTMGGAT